MNVIMLKGLPGSGKTTWAKQFIEEHRLKGNIYRRVNRDELRLMNYYTKFDKHDERYCTHLRDAIILETLRNGDNLIIDETNLKQRHEYRYRELINKFIIEKQLSNNGDYSILFDVKSFMSVPVEECIKHDLGRPNPVGEGVINKMYNECVIQNE